MSMRVCIVKLHLCPFAIKIIDDDAGGECIGDYGVKVEPTTKLDSIEGFK